MRLLTIDFLPTVSLNFVLRICCAFWKQKATVMSSAIFQAEHLLRSDRLPYDKMGSTVNLSMPDVKGKFASTNSMSNTVLSKSQNRLVNKDGSYSIDHADPPDALKKYWRCIGGRNDHSFHLVLC